MISAILNEYEQFLYREEKSDATIKKYLRDVRSFLLWQEERELSKDLVIQWKIFLTESGYSVRSINSMLASVHHYLVFLGREDCRVQVLKLQPRIFTRPEQELDRDDYLKLLDAAKQKPRLYLILQTMSATGIRVSELKYFTVEAVRRGEVMVNCKKKCRPVLIPRKLRAELLRYACRNGITEGIIFRTRNGRPVDRSNLWAEMKKLAQRAGVLLTKVFPHNLRKLFARGFYEIKKDIAKLADVLGHSSIETTRIYIMTSGGEHEEILNQMNMVL
ncbi:MAG: tyrosine-type recombinase/integrase [Oscillospiraceae bacterium]|nr:tyrosine-type recombinase/integrase [Oscillospiraceae bacterium]